MSAAAFIRQIGIARRYAKALADAAEQKDAQDRIKEELREFLRLFNEDKLVRAYLCDIRAKSTERQRVVSVISKYLKFSDFTENFLLSVAHHARFEYIKSIVAQYERLLDERRGALKIKVMTPQPLRAEERKKLENIVARKTGKTVESEILADRSLIAGFVLKIGSTVYDASLRSRVRKLGLGERSGEL